MTRLFTAQLGVGEVDERDFDVRVDVRPGMPRMNVQGDARTLAVAAHALALIKASHLVEHFDRAEQVQVLAEWHRALAPGGILLLWTPDRSWFEDAFAQRQINKDEHDITLGVGGRRRYDYPESLHKFVWRAEDAYVILGQAGFEVLSSSTVAGGSLFVVARSL